MLPEAASKPTFLPHLHAQAPNVILLRTANGSWITWLSSSASPTARRPRSPVLSLSLPLELSDRSWYNSCIAGSRRNRIPGRRNPCPTIRGSHSPLPYPLSPPLLLLLPLLPQITWPLPALRIRPPLRRPRRDVAKTDFLTCPISSLLSQDTVRCCLRDYPHRFAMYVANFWLNYCSSM